MKSTRNVIEFLSHFNWIAIYIYIPVWEVNIKERQFFESLWYYISWSRPWYYYVMPEQIQGIGCEITGQRSKFILDLEIIFNSRISIVFCSQSSLNYFLYVLWLFKILTCMSFSSQFTRFISIRYPVIHEIIKIQLWFFDTIYKMQFYDHLYISY